MFPKYAQFINSAKEYDFKDIVNYASTFMMMMDMIMV